MDQVLAFQITTVEEILRVKPTLSRVSYQSPISCTVQDLFITARQSSFQNSFHTLLFVFWWTKSSHTRSQLWKRLLGWSWRHHGSAISHPSLLHSSRSVHHSKTVQFPKQFSRSSLSLFFFFFLFFGDHNCKRDFEGEADAITGQLLVTHPLCTVQDLFSTARQSTFQNSFHALLYSFWRTRSKHPRSQLTPLRLAISHSSLVHSLRSIKEVSVVGNSKRINSNLFVFHGWYFSITSFSNGHKYLWNIENSCCKKLNFREVEKL